MPTIKRSADYFDTAEGIQLEEMLRRMEASEEYYTVESYSANTNLYANNRISFTEKHKTYIYTHSSVDPEKYMANLRLMTRVK